MGFFKMNFPDHQLLLLMYSTKIDNQVEMPPPYGGSFNMRFVPVVDKHGTHELPDMFYEGVMFGISHGNSHNVEV